MRKKESKECYCACCRTPRTLQYDRLMKGRHYLQIFILTLVLTFATYPWFQWKAVTAMPLIWAIFESFHKSLYRKELSCPYCGFDPTWYKKDVRLARRKVEEFLKQNPESHIVKRAKRSEENSFQSLN
jgi:hypothetical protein